MKPTPELVEQWLTAANYGYTKLAELAAEWGSQQSQAMLLSDCKRKDALLRRALAVIRWHAFGECRTPGVDGLPTASEVAAEIKTELGEMP